VKRPTSSTRVSALAAGLAAAVLAATPLAARAETAPTDRATAPVPAATAPATSATEKAPDAVVSTPQATGGPPAAPAPPADADAALQRARAAYEYGEMEMVVDSARLVAEGRLHPSPAQRAQALRYLGIGLFLTGRQEGAETAFFDLLRLRPRARIDATTTRPDVVAFFEDVRRRHAAEINEAASNRPGKSLALAFLPPISQFQSGHKARGFTIAALEVLSLAGAIATNLQLRSWDSQYPNHTFAPPPGMPGPSHAEAAKTLKTLNYVSVAVLFTTVIVGIVDGVASYTAVEPEDAGTSVADIFGNGYRF
jgi:hypothetical protein